MAENPLHLPPLRHKANWWDAGRGPGNSVPSDIAQVSSGDWEGDGIDAAEETMEVVDSWSPEKFPPDPPALRAGPESGVLSRGKREAAHDASWTAESGTRPQKRSRGSTAVPTVSDETVSSAMPSSSSSANVLDDFFSSRPGAPVREQKQVRAQPQAEVPPPVRPTMQPPARPSGQLPIRPPAAPISQQSKDGKGAGKRRLVAKGKASKVGDAENAVKGSETSELAEGASTAAHLPGCKGSKKGGLAKRPVTPSISQQRKGNTTAPKAALAKCVRISVTPAEWNHQDIEKLCDRFGQVDSVMPASPSGYEVAFAQPQEAESAALAVAGLEVDGEAGPVLLDCELLPADASPSQHADSTLQGADVKSWHAASFVNAQVFGDIAGKGHPIHVYVDELQLLDTDPDACDHEVFLRNLPIHDYTTSELHTWLQAFGDVEDLFFRRDRAGLMGSGYIRYRMHSEAADLVQTLFSNSEHASSSRPGVMQASWSLSERMLQDSSKGLRIDLCKVLAKNFGRLQESQCSALALVGDGRGNGRLHFVVWLRERCEKVLSGVNGLLAELLAEGLSQEPEDEQMRSETVAEAPKEAVQSKNEQAVAEPMNGRAASSELRYKNEAEKKQEDKKHEEDYNPDDFMRHCIFLQGFPQHWKKKDVEQFFEPYGRATAVRFVEDPIGRAAQVELESTERMARAVDGLNNKEMVVKDSQQRFVLQCELIGEENICTSHNVFIDELPMLAKPDVQPGKNDREVFLRGLPLTIASEDDLVQWLSGFGMIEDALVLRDENNFQSKGKAYVRFKGPQSACACIKMHSIGNGVEAQWSESERALQRTLSVYRADLQDAFADRSGDVLPAVLEQAQVSKLFMRTMVQHTAPTAARRIHFIAECSYDQFEGVRVVLSNVLASFHARVAARLSGWILPQVPQPVVAVGAGSNAATAGEVQRAPPNGVDKFRRSF